ncbi:tripartite tricarboxylate transporter TctB family protein [Kocuria kalidii]|uniref:tripartite tricarboxylate transporter TctB family protein n=1 Tax=Kocuria kalidii TaxID=3376283 RepID=UPI0037B28B8E
MGTTEESPSAEPAVADDEVSAESSPGPGGTNVRGLLVASAVAVVGGTTMWSARTLETSAVGASIGPQWWPTVLGGVLVAGAVAIGVVALRRPDPVPEQRVSAHGLGRLGAVVAAVVLYGLGWYYFHFLPVTAVFLAALMFVTGGRGTKALIVFPISTAAILYGLFGLLLRVPL